MIGVAGQYFFDLTIDGFDEEFLTPEDFSSFTLIEQVGNVLPSFELKFLTTNRNLLNYLNEGNTIKVKYGKDREGEEETYDADLIIYHLKTSGVDRSKRVVYTNGSLYAPKYLNDPKITISNKSSGVVVIKKITAVHFKKADTSVAYPDFNITTSKDSQYWVQHGISDRQFVNDIWLHLDLPGSFPIVGISAQDNRFILKDVVKAIAKKPAFTFTNSVAEDETYIPYAYDYVIEQNSGFINSWLGYGREKPVHTIETSALTKVLAEMKTLMAVSNKFSRTTDIVKKTSDIGLQSDNVHSNWWAAYQRNIQHLAMFSSSRVRLTAQTGFFPVKVLDVVDFYEPDISTEYTQASGQTSGKYLVEQVGRTITANTLTTNVILTREGMGESLGKLR